MPKRNEWTDIDRLGTGIATLIRQHSSSALRGLFQESSDRELMELLEDHLIAAEPYIDCRVHWLLGEIKLRLWRANHGELESGARAELVSHMAVAACENGPGFEHVAAQHENEFRRRPHLSDCACEECELQ